MEEAGKGTHLRVQDLTNLIASLTLARTGGKVMQ